MLKSLKRNANAARRNQLESSTPPVPVYRVVALLAPFFG